MAEPLCLPRTWLRTLCHTLNSWLSLLEADEDITAYPVKTGSSGRRRIWQMRLFNSGKDPGPCLAPFILVRNQDLDWGLPAMSYLGLQHTLPETGSCEGHCRDLQITSGKLNHGTEVESWRLAGSQGIQDRIRPTWINLKERVFSTKTTLF